MMKTGLWHVVGHATAWPQLLPHSLLPSIEFQLPQGCRQPTSLSQTLLKKAAIVAAEGDGRVAGNKKGTPEGVPLQ